MTLAVMVSRNVAQTPLFRDRAIGCCLGWVEGMPVTPRFIRFPAPVLRGLHLHLLHPDELFLPALARFSASSMLDMHTRAPLLCFGLCACHPPQTGHRPPAPPRKRQRLPFS